MLDDIAGAYGSRFFLAAGGVGIALLVLIGILWIMRNRAPSPFVRGGKNRQPRLQVLDAAAVDARRRLVLVRRDGIEHLIMIGGPTDIVIESGISDATRAGTSATPVDIPMAFEERQSQQQKAAAVEAPPATLPQRQQTAEDKIEAYLRNEPRLEPTAQPTPVPQVADPRNPLPSSRSNRRPSLCRLSARRKPPTYWTLPDMSSCLSNNRLPHSRQQPSLPPHQRHRSNPAMISSVFWKRKCRRT